MSSEKDSDRAPDHAPSRFSALIAPPLPEGRWEVRLDGRPVHVLGSAAARLPCGGAVSALRPERRHGDRLSVVAGPEAQAETAERSAYGRRLLRAAHYRDGRTTLPLRDTVLYAGGDSPRAVHTELVRRGTETEHLWVTGTTPGRTTHVPPGARAVPVHSAAWYEALARSRRIVTDEQLPGWFERRPGQTVVQTWHGTPLGRFGGGLADTLYADHQYLATLPRRSAQWSVLVSPSRFATPWLRRSLGYGGEVLEAGSPANDVLFPPDRDKAAEGCGAGSGSRRTTASCCTPRPTATTWPIPRRPPAVRLPARTAGTRRSPRAPWPGRSAPATRFWSGGTPGSPVGSRTGPVCSTCPGTRGPPGCCWWPTSW